MAASIEMKELGRVEAETKLTERILLLETREHELQTEVDTLSRDVQRLKQSLAELEVEKDQLIASEDKLKLEALTLYDQQRKVTPRYYSLSLPQLVVKIIHPRNLS